MNKQMVIQFIDNNWLEAGIANRGGGGGVLPPLPPSLEPQPPPPPPPLAASEVSRHFFRVFSSFFAFNHD